MKVILDDQEYQIKQLTIEQYIALREDNIDEVSLISILTGADPKTIRQAPMTQVKFVANLLMSDMSPLEDASPLVLDMEFKGREYGLISPSKMSYEEWINLEVFMAQKPVDLLKMATHLYRPLKNQKYGEERELIPYDLDECISRENEFKDFPISVCLSALFFLTTFAKTLTEDFLSSTPNKKMNPKQIKKFLTKKLSNLS